MEIIELDHSKDDPGLNLFYNGELKWTITGDIENYDEIMAWLFENTEHRFSFLGTHRVYFEDSEDAMAFKLRWI